MPDEMVYGAPNLFGNCLIPNWAPHYALPAPSLTPQIARDILGSLIKWLESPFLLLNYTNYSFETAMILLAFAEESITLVPDGTIFLHIAIILLMIWILNRTLFRPINRVLEERERKGGSRTGEAQSILAQVEDKVSQYEKTLRETRSEGYHLMEAQRAEAMAIRQEKVNTVKEEVSAKIAEEKSELQKQADAARATLGNDAQKIAENITATILKNA
jgi:F-type H+-transporting ATPase subunit b